MRSGQGLLGHGRAELKKLERVRVATLNVGTTTGRGGELADLIERRKVGVLCVQETRWKVNKAKEVGGGCKLLRSGANEHGKWSGDSAIQRPEGRPDQCEQEE